MHLYDLIVIGGGVVTHLVAHRRVGVNYYPNVSHNYTIIRFAKVNLLYVFTPLVLLTVFFTLHVLQLTGSVAGHHRHRNRRLTHVLHQGLVAVGLVLGEFIDDFLVQLLGEMQNLIHMCVFNNAFVLC